MGSMRTERSGFEDVWDEKVLEGDEMRRRELGESRSSMFG